MDSLRQNSLRRGVDSPDRETRKTVQLSYICRISGPGAVARGEVWSDDDGAEQVKIGTPWGNAMRGMCDLRWLSELIRPESDTADLYLKPTVVLGMDGGFGG